MPLCVAETGFLIHSLRKDRHTKETVFQLPFVVGLKTVSLTVKQQSYPPDTALLASLPAPEQLASLWGINVSEK